MILKKYFTKILPHPVLYSLIQFTFLILKAEGREGFTKPLCLNTTLMANIPVSPAQSLDMHTKDITRT